MSYISKYDTKFITFVNKKYNKNFKFFDDYILWLFYKRSSSEGIYYRMLEKDIWDYSDMQTGTPREHERLNDNWKKKEKDPYGLYNGNENYLYALRSMWKNDK